MRALIVEDGNARAALAAVRALSAAGVESATASPRKGLAAHSRFCLAWHEAPPAHTEGYAGEIGSLCEKHGYEVVLPAGDVEMIALSFGRNSVPAPIPLPLHERVEGVVNKMQLARTMSTTDILMPETAEATDDFLGSAAYPLVLKPDLQWAPGRPPPSARLDVRVLDAAGPARKRAAALRAEGAVPIAQPLVSGQLVAVAAVVDASGNLQGLVAQEATRMWPPGRGISAAAVTVDPDPFRSLVEKIIDATGWVGLLQAQLLKGAGSLVLIDINVRLYGSISLGVAAGVNLPALWAQTTVGPSPSAARPSEGRVGVRYQWLEGDLKRAIREKQGGLLPDLLGVAGRALTSHHSISSWKDPAPAVAAVRRLRRDPPGRDGR